MKNVQNVQQSFVLVDVVAAPPAALSHSLGPAQSTKTQTMDGHNLTLTAATCFQN